MSVIIEQCRQSAKQWLQSTIPRRLRTHREFAEQELFLTSGQYEGRRFRVDRQPWSGLWLDECDRLVWQELVATGPSQSGKTILCFVEPTLYHLFEVQERVICGVPDMEIAKDKWFADLLPMIERTRFREYLPTGGAGGRGGFAQRVQFSNGASLKWMSAGGGDKSRAAYTARVLIVTETDGIARNTEGSTEADAMLQMEARLRAYPNKRIYKEGTLTVEEGHTWQRYQAGTASKLMLPCPKCHNLVCPERDNFVWAGDDVREAAATASFVCPSCSEPWSYADRVKANSGAILVHRGQEVTPDNKIVGDPADTNVLGFRWSAVNNLLIDADTIAIDEYNASIAADEDNAQRMMHQFVWALPYVSDSFESTKLDEKAVQRKQITTGKGIVPKECQVLTASIDVHKRWIYYVVMAWLRGSCHVVDYEKYDLRSDCTEDVAIADGLEAVLSLLSPGFVVDGSADKRLCDAVICDSGYKPTIVTAFAKSHKNVPVHPFLGRGVTQEGNRHVYTRPQISKIVLNVGEEWHVSYDRTKRAKVITANVDHWKTWAHARISESQGCPMTLHAAPPNRHSTFIRHLSAEHSESEFVAGKGTVTKWIRDRANNHYFDCVQMNCVLASVLGYRLVVKGSANSRERQKRQHNRTDFYRLR